MFEKPNCTQVPNDLLENIRNLSERNIRVSLVVSLFAFSMDYEIEGMGVSDVARLSGLSEKDATSALQEIYRSDDMIASNLEDALELKRVGVL